MNKTIKSLLYSFCFLVTIAKGNAEPQLTFFTQLPAHKLENVFADTLVLQQLKSLNASVNMAMLDFSDVRAQAIEVLNAWEIPVQAQLMLPRRDQYFLTINKADLAVKRYEEFQAWVKEKKLVFDGASLTIEPMLEDIKKLNEGHMSLALQAYNRLSNEKVGDKAKRVYQNLISQMQADGYKVTEFIYPFTLEAKSDTGEALQRLTGLLDLDTDYSVPMFFSNSFQDPLGPSLMISYGKEDRFDGIAIGSTGGEMELQQVEVPRPLSWAFLNRDMCLAAQFSDKLYVYTLEGCIEAGYFNKISSIDMAYGKTVADRYNIKQAEKLRANMNTVMKVLNYPLAIMIGIFAVLILAIIAIWRLLQRIISN